MRRLFISFFALIFAFGCVSNRKLQNDSQVPVIMDSTVLDYPFQVIYANSVVKSDSKTAIEKFQKLERNEEIILKNGQLLISHLNGLFFEFEGDLVINLEKVHVKESFRQNEKFLKRPEIRNLYSNKPFAGDPFPGEVIYSHNPPPLYFPLLNPNENKYHFTSGSIIRLYWGFYTKIEPSERPYNYFITIKNIYDEEISRLESNSSFVDIDFNKYENEDKVYLIGLSGVNSQGKVFNAREIAFEEESEILLPEYRDYTVGTSIEALQYAFKYENEGNLYRAKIYYEQATRLSEKQIYFDMLTMFYDRLTNIAE